MHETLDWIWRLAALEFLVMAWGYAAFALAARLLPACGVALRWTAAGVAGLWLLTVAFHLLLALSAFTLLPALALGLVTALAAFVTCGRLEPARLLARDVATLVRQLRPEGPPARRAAAFGGVFVVLTLALRATLVPVVAWDSLTYHAVKSAMWVQLGGPLQWVAPGGLAVYRDYPGGGELLQSWAMLPLRSDVATGVLDAALWLLLGVSVHALGARLSLGLAARWTSAAYVLAVPAVARAAGSLYVDNALAFALVAACALILYARRHGGAGSRVLAAMALGVGVGIKILALPVAGAGLALVAGLSLSRPGRARALAGLTAGAAAFLAAAGPWFASNWWRTGYPLSPFPVEVAGVTLGRATRALAWYMDRPATAAAGLHDELHALAQTFGIPGTTPLDEPTLGAASVVVVLTAGVALAWLARRDRLAALVTLAFVLPTFGSFFGAGMRNTRLIWAAVSGRYLLGALAVCVVIGLVPGWRRWQAAYRGLLAAAAAAYVVVTDVRGWTGTEALTAAAGALAILALAALCARLPPAWPRIALAFALLAGPWGLGLYRAATRDDALAHSVVLHRSPRYWVPALPAIDDPGRPRTLAVTAGASQDNDNWLLYPFLGRRFQNTLVYVPVTADGVIVDLADNETRLARASYDAWRERLSRRGVDEVVSFAPRSLELTWMERRPGEFQRLAGDGRRWGVYQVAGATGD